MTPDCAAPGAVWIAVVFGVCVIGAPMGFMVAAVLAAGAREDVARTAYRLGLQDARWGVDRTEPDGNRWDVRIPEPLP